jgi:hypothetical protein
MRRSLTAREWILLGVLAVLALASGYMMLFYLPSTSQRDTAREETGLYQLQTEAAQLRLAEKRRMERELDALFAQEEEPLGLAPYDNLQAVMFELHGILDQTREYSLSFGTVDTEQAIVRRSISLTFTSGSYEEAKSVLQQLNDSAFRCMLSDLSISLGQTGEGLVSVSGTIVFFEYKPQS